MPGMPAAGGWGGSNRTLGIQVEGFTDEEIAKAVDHCDNDRIKTIKYLNKLKGKGGAYQWKPELEKKLEAMEKPMKDLCTKLLAYDNVPNKQKTFINFAKNSLALNKQPHLAEKMWELVQDIIKKPAVPNQQSAQKSMQDAEKETAVAEEEMMDGEDAKKKNKKKKREKEGGEDEGGGDEGGGGKGGKRQKKQNVESESDENEDRKDKKKPAQQQEAVASEGEDDDDAEAKEAARKEKKAAKKAAKKAKKAAEAEAEAEAQAAAEKAARKAKKKEKKEKRKHESEEEGGEEAEAVAEVKSEKKKKKSKEAGDTGGDESAKPKKHTGPVEADARGFNFYKEKEAVKTMDKATVDKWRSTNGLTVSNLTHNPITKFADAPMDKSIMACTKTFEKPSVIQAQCWPVLLAGRDIVGIASTGSGKTLAFGLPGLTHLIERGVHQQTKTTSMLILAPTRELAMQSDVVLKNVGANFGIKTVCVYGGAPKNEQKALLKAGCQVLVATPGRLIDFMQEGVVDLSKVSFLVLDEADRMMDVGFEKEVRSIIGACAKVHQTAMFSATWPQSIVKISEELLNNPARVTVGSQDLAANHRVKQIVEVLEPAAKDRRLLEVIKKYHNGSNRIIIFGLYKKECDRVHQLIEGRTQHKVAAIHGDRGQEQRTKAIGEFKSGAIPLLVATDVAARGLDIPDVEFVINYTFPLTTEDYVHRIGRTGRAGKEGVSHTFFTQFDKARAGELVNVLREAKQTVPEELMKFGTHVKKKEHGLFGAHFKEVDMSLKATKKTFDDDSDDE